MEFGLKLMNWKSWIYAIHYNILNKDNEKKISYNASPNFQNELII